MARETIEIQVEPDAARAYSSASAEQRRKLDLLLSLRIREATRPGADLETIMDEITRRARERGLTQAKLDELLEDEQYLVSQAARVTGRLPEGLEPL